MIGLVVTVLNLLALYIAVSITAIVVFTVLGSSARDIPEEVLVLGFLWPVTVPVFVIQTILFKLRGARYD